MLATEIVQIRKPRNTDLAVILGKFAASGNMIRHREVVAYCDKPNHGVLAVIGESGRCLGGVLYRKGRDKLILLDRVVPESHTNSILDALERRGRRPQLA